MAITELPQLKLVVITIYRPSLENFSLIKFNNMLNELQKYLKDRENNYDIALTGDFNFNPTVVTWVKSADGLFPDIRTGSTEEKLGFQLLYDIMNEYRLEQLVDKPTRENNILDLILTGAPERFSGCTTTIMKPHSDHNLIQLAIAASVAQPPADRNRTTDQIGMGNYNFKRANPKQLKQALKEFDWNSKFSNLEGITHTEDLWINGIEEILTSAKVPRFQNKNNDNS